VSFFEKAVTVFWAQALRTHQQHTLQSFKNMLLSRNLDQNMHKNALFLEKSEKSPQCWGLRLQTPVGLRQLGAPLPNPRVVTQSSVTVTFSKERL